MISAIATIIVLVYQRNREAVNASRVRSYSNFYNIRSMVASTMAAPVASSVAAIPTVFQVIIFLSVRGIYLTAIFCQ